MPKAVFNQETIFFKLLHATIICPCLPSLSRQIKKVRRKYLEIKVYVTSERKVHLKIRKKSPFKNWKQKSLKRMEIDRWLKLKLKQN